MIAATATKRRAHLEHFSGSLSGGGGKPARRFVAEALYGIAARQSVRLTEIGRALEEPIALAKAITRARRRIPEILSDMTNELSEMARDAIAELWDLFCDLDRRIASFDKKIAAVFRTSPACQRIARIKGVGPKTATAIVAAIGEGKEFRNGRHLAAWLGLVPRQHSSGDKRTMLGISKRGSQHLRTLLVHGARAVVRTASNQTDPLNRWVNNLRERRGYNRATVAVANKNARIIWAVLRTGEPYRAAA